MFLLCKTLLPLLFHLSVSLVVPPSTNGHNGSRVENQIDQSKSLERRFPIQYTRKEATLWFDDSGVVLLVPDVYSEKDRRNKIYADTLYRMKKSVMEHLGLSFSLPKPDGHLEILDTWVFREKEGWLNNLVWSVRPSLTSLRRIDMDGGTYAADFLESRPWLWRVSYIVTYEYERDPNRESNYDWYRIRDGIDQFWENEFSEGRASSGVFVPSRKIDNAPWRGFVTDEEVRAAEMKWPWESAVEDQNIGTADVASPDSGPQYSASASYMDVSLGLQPWLDFERLDVHIGGDAGNGGFASGSNQGNVDSTFNNKPSQSDPQVKQGGQSNSGPIDPSFLMGLHNIPDVGDSNSRSWAEHGEPSESTHIDSDLLTGLVNIPDVGDVDFEAWWAKWDPSNAHKHDE